MKIMGRSPSFRAVHPAWGADGAGTAWLDDAKPWAGKGGTGVGVRTLVDLAMNFPAIPAGK